MERANEPPIRREALRSPETLPTELLVMPWRDEVIEALGFGPRSMYVEMVWTGVLGPTATLLYRRLGSWAEFNHDGTNVDLTDMAVSLGLGEGLGKSSLMARSLGRLVHFGAARWAGAAELQVRQALPPIPLRLASRLSYTARRLHEEYTRHANGAQSGRSE
jgi:hypothetical protein